MTLDIIKLQTTWNDAAGSINSNYAKIADAIAQLKANGGGGGGGADIDLTDYATKVWVEAKGYITASALTPYLKTEDAKETYATKDFVNNKLANYATVNSVTAIQNTLTGQIGAVNASVEQLAATKLDSSYFTLTNIKSTLGISDWALAATKPSYAWSEITSRPTALSQFTDDVVSGKYLPLGGGTISGASGDLFAINRTSGNPQIRFESNGSLLGYLGFTSGAGIVRIGADSYHILHSGNIGNYNAGSATKLQTPRTLWGQSFDGTKNITLGLTLDGYKSTGTVSQISDLGDKGLVVSVDGKRNNYGMAFWVEGNGKGYIQQQAFGSSTTYSLCIQPFGGNVGIGNTSPTERLDVSGNIKASGNINATSITINGVTITASNGSITVNGNVLATGDITGGV